MRTPFLLALILTCSFLAGCPKPKNGVLEACQQYRRLLFCEANLQEELPTALDCNSLKSKFELICSQADIDYARGVFTADADRMCALKSKEQLKQFKSSFDKEKVSAVCYQAAEACGADCIDIDVNEIP